MNDCYELYKKKINTKSKTELVQIYPFPKEAN